MNPVNTPTQLRLTHNLLERAGALIAAMAADPEVRALGMPTRTAVLRLAIARGLQDLERQYQAPAVAGEEAPHGRSGMRGDAAKSHTAAMEGRQS
jgi:hypothetical protein